MSYEENYMLCGKLAGGDCRLEMDSSATTLKEGADVLTDGSEIGRYMVHTL